MFNKQELQKVIQDCETLFEHKDLLDKVTSNNQSDYISFRLNSVGFEDTLFISKISSQIKEQPITLAVDFPKSTQLEIEWLGCQKKLLLITYNPLNLIAGSTLYPELYHPGDWVKFLNKESKRIAQLAQIQKQKKEAQIKKLHFKKDDSGFRFKSL